MYIDSDASGTFINFDSHLSSPRSTPSPMTVTLPNGSLEKLSTEADFKGYNVLYAPMFKNSLFSVPQFCANQNKIFLFTSSNAFGINLTTASATLLESLVRESESTRSICIRGDY